MSENYFIELNSVNVNDHTEKKNNLTYLSWAWAVAEATKRYPDMTYTIWKDELNRPYIFDEGLGYMVFTSVTISGETKEMWLPVMDGANKAMRDLPYVYRVKNPNFKYATKGDDGKFYDKYGREQPEYIEKTCEAATMFDINTAIMRCLVKNLAMFGLGLYIYAGEDLPEDEQDSKPAVDEKTINNYVAVISKLLAETNTDGAQMLDFVNKKFKTSAQAFKDLNAQQLVFAMEKLRQKKEKQ